jgi:prepilin-type processing-associated H-X9-DG protein
MSAVKLLDIKTPCTKIVMGDIMMADKSKGKRPLDLNIWGPYWTPAFAQSIVADWHDGKSNMMFADFSVSRQMSKDQYSDGKLYKGWWPLQ